MSKLFNISEASNIAVHSLAMMANHKEHLSATQLSEALHLSKNHIAKVLQRLVKNDMLKSVRGPAGGFTLKKDSATITLLDIYQSIEGNLDVGDCPLSYDLCGFERCLMGTVVNKLTSEFRTFLEEKTLQSYL